MKSQKQRLLDLAQQLATRSNLGRRIVKLRFFEDFPEFVTDKSFRNSVLLSVRDIIQEVGEQKVGEKESLFREKFSAVKTLGGSGLEIRHDAIGMSTVFLPIFYEFEAPTENDYDKRKVLDKTLAQLAVMQLLARSNLARTYQRAIDDAFEAALHGRGEFGLSLPELQKVIAERHRIRFSAGRKRKSSERRRFEEEETRAIFQEFKAVLAPAFDGIRSKTEVFEEVLSHYGTDLSLRWGHSVEKMADKLHRIHKIERAALFLTARKLDVHEDTAARRLGKRLS
ncbi:hypothetical protein MYX75_03900 [Acidobacteria bacterium AH-259-A15]|nr:hypothetical protein [Acidobacteria bacterium AH-259-A15]